MMRSFGGGLTLCVDLQEHYWKSSGGSKCTVSVHVLYVIDNLFLTYKRIQLLLISRLLIDLRQASEQDIHASSLTSSILNSQLSDAIAVTASSTLRFQRPGSSREWQSTGA